MAETYNPILGKEEISGLRLFQSRPKPEPGVALVLFKEGQPLVTLWPGGRLTAGEARWGSYKAAYKIDVAEHSFTFNCNLPCQSDAFDFQAEVNVTYSVDDPAAIIKNNTNDARSVLEPLITDTMRSLSRKYDVEDSAAAERAIADAVKSESYDVGFKLNRFVVKLRLEEDARAHLRNLKQLERDKVREKKAAELTFQRDQIEIERQKMKMEFYGPLIEKGQWQLLALQLSNHPEDVTGVAQMLHQQRQADVDRQLTALKIMLEEGALEGFQLEEAGKRVLQRFIDNFGPELGAKAIAGPEERKALTQGKNKVVKTEALKSHDKETGEENE